MLRRFRAFPTLIMSVALLAVGVSFGAPSVVRASAASCPTVSHTPGITYWVADYQQRGVTLCRGFDDTGYVKAYVQVVDLTQGARLRVMSEAAAGQTLGTPNTQFNKRTVADWYTWVRSNVTSPDQGLVFSVTNAAFFTDTNNSHATTALSMPEKKWMTVMSQGYALGDHGDPAWTAAKRKFGFSDPRVTPQSAFAGDFPAASPDNTTYTASDITSATRGLGGYFDGTVALHPYAGASRDFRTYIGLRGATWNGAQDHVYILTSLVQYTQQEARDLLVNDFGTMWNIQLDGGNSTQFYSLDGRVDSALCGNPIFGGCRKVPEVLVVYVSPWN